MTDPLGLSIGTTVLMAVRAGRAPVSCESVPVAPGRTEPDMAALADALDGLAEAVGYGAPVVVAVPAHWTPMTIDALRTALTGKPRLATRGAPPTLVTDAAAATTGLGGEPGLPRDGILALCNLDGEAGITLINAGAGFAPISGTVRHTGPVSAIADTIVATLARDRVPTARLAGVALIGAGATEPTVGAALSQRLQVPVLTPEQPACTAAAGALLMAGGRLPDLNVSTPSVIATPAAALAWSQDDSRAGEPLPYSAADYNYAGAPARPRRSDPATARFAVLKPTPWYRRPVVLVVLLAAAILAATGGLAYTLSGSTGPQPAPPTATSTPPEPAGGR